MSYGRSLQALRTQLAKATPVQYEDVLWCTFLLGLFELISESSGDSWAQHMCYGTSKILQMAGPTKSSSSLRRTLFDAFRVLEATRAIMYGDETFLSQDTWLSYHPSSGLKQSGAPDLMETIYTLMIQASSFANVLFDQVESIPEALRYNDPNIIALARHGLQIQHSIRSWYPGNASHLKRTDCYAQLAFANYHALELFHCKNFTYHSCWENKAVPYLDLNQIDEHVTGILDVSEQVLEASIVPAVTLLFALRMAGANASATNQEAKVMEILGQIHRSGFVVADRIKVDVQELLDFQAARKRSSRQ
ncbi:hypothetical protein BR93DRAFT_884966 [Coniochaeta sp. PMI_546]|nr:hypothetical protein BR93DRAFT_884966 [Coniochaeta sp. PMI_546]